jgi:hypothetical protein
MIRKLLDSIFNIFPVFIRRWEIQTYLHSTFLPWHYLHNVWGVVVRRVDALYFCYHWCIIFSYGVPLITFHFCTMRQFCRNVAKCKHVDTVSRVICHYIVPLHNNITFPLLICRSQWPRGLRLLKHWDRGFESHSRHGCLYYVLLFCDCVVLCVGRGLATDWSPVQGVLPTVYRIKKLNKCGQGPTKGCRPIIIIIIITYLTRFIIINY